MSAPVGGVLTGYVHGRVLLTSDSFVTAVARTRSTRRHRRPTSARAEEARNAREQLKQFGRKLLSRGADARNDRANSSAAEWPGERDFGRRAEPHAPSREGGDIERYMRETLGSSDERPQAATWKVLLRAGDAVTRPVTEQFERLLYRYYNWRRDTSSDLLLILALNLFFIMSGAFLKYIFVDTLLPSDNEASISSLEQLPWFERIWPDIYKVTLLTFGENFPGEGEPWILQAYSVAMALLGVIGFALLLGLTERIILEVIESNVQQGTKVFEKGHVVVLTHAVAGKDMEALWRILNQVCWAYASAGGTTIVVLCNREKVTMESVFRDVLPDTKGSTIVFRQGNPLLPSDLNEVSCASASSVIVVSDNSRDSNEADAQTVRTCILIDELVQKAETEQVQQQLALEPPPHIVVEILNAENCKALQFATEVDVHMVLTRNMNAKRLARMVLTPVLAGVSTMLFDFRTTSQQYTQCFPELKGKLFKDVPFLFDRATVIGLFPAQEKGELVISPSPGYVMQEDDRLLLLRSSKLRPAEVSPTLDRRRPRLRGWKPPILQNLVTSDAGETIAMQSRRHSPSDDGTDAAVAQDKQGIVIGARSQRALGIPEDSSFDDAQQPGSPYSQATATLDSVDFSPASPLSSRSGSSGEERAVRDTMSRADGLKQRFYVLPEEYAQSRNENVPVKLLIVGWGQQSFMQALLHELDQGDQSLPVASEVVFLNTWQYDASVGAAVDRVRVSCLHVKHIQAHPLVADTFTSVIDIAQFSCAICLCDSLWIDADGDSTNGVDFMEQGDMLRLDSMLLMAQLHIRTALKEQNLPDINIICEKLAIAGVTRFEDRFRLPLGISVNMTSYAAKMLVQTMYDPDHGIRLVTAFGRHVNVNVIDSSVLCSKGEVISWWELVARAQMCRLVLFAYYDIPATLDIPLKLHSNPALDRSQRRVWNDGSSRRKLICFETQHVPANLDLVSGMPPVNTFGNTVDLRDVGTSRSVSPELDALSGMHSTGSFDKAYLSNVQLVDLNDGATLRHLMTEEGLMLASQMLESQASVDTQSGEPRLLGVDRKRVTPDSAALDMSDAASSSSSSSASYSYSTEEESSKDRDAGAAMIGMEQARTPAHAVAKNLFESASREEAEEARPSSSDGWSLGHVDDWQQRVAGPSDTGRVPLNIPARDAWQRQQGMLHGTGGALPMGSSIVAALQSLYEGSASAPSRNGLASNDRNGSAHDTQDIGTQSPSAPGQFTADAATNGKDAAPTPSEAASQAQHEAVATAEAASATTYVRTADGSQVGSADRDAPTPTAKRVTHMANGRVTITQASTSPKTRKNIEQNLQETPFPGVIEQFRDN